MPLSQKQIKDVEDALKNRLRNKFQHHNPEPASMPFHTRLLGKDRLALYSFIHSLNTNFGITIFEPVALALAHHTFKSAVVQAKVGNEMSSTAQYEIQNIINELSTASSKPNKKKEIERIRVVANKGNMVEVKPTKIDLMLESKTGEYFLFDIKTAKPNVGAFKEFKRTLLEWVAVLFAKNPNAKVNTLIAIPYNPYEPEPYSRWTMRGMLDLNAELKVAQEFWDFLGGKDTYKDLLNCFERVGVELKEEIDNYFKEFNKK